MNILIHDKELIMRLALAIVLGMLIGAERLFVHKEAGMKTHSLVAMGAALFMIISEIMAEKYASFPGFNPAMMSSQIIVGIGFLGAGSIIFQGTHLKGLTTAGGLWVTAGIGMAAGFGLYDVAIISTVLVLIIFFAMIVFEKPLLRIAEKNLAERNPEIK